jgi:hypothetical protein
MAVSIFETDYFVLHFPRHSSSFSLHQFSPSPPPLSLWWNRKCFPLCWRLVSHCWKLIWQCERTKLKTKMLGRLHTNTDRCMHLAFYSNISFTCACVCVCVLCVCVCVCVFEILFWGWILGIHVFRWNCNIFPPLPCFIQFDPHFEFFHFRQFISLRLWPVGWVKVFQNLRKKMWTEM